MGVMAALSITLCDDSRFARQQLERALPVNWAVKIHYAENGRQALSAVRDGRAEVLFLDLTMPEMDGIQVLRALRSEGLSSIVFVVSADIQSSIRQTVLDLGARHFLSKPVDARALAQALSEAGLDIEGGSNAVSMTQSVELKDWLREMLNVAMGQAGERLSHILGVTVSLSIPTVNELEAADLNMAIEDTLRYAGSALITQGFIGGGLNGECMVYLGDIDLEELRAQLSLEASSPADELLMDLAGVMNGALLQGLFHQFDRHVTISQPAFLRSMGNAAQQHVSMGQSLSAEVIYDIESLRLRCIQLLVFTQPSVARLHAYAKEWGL